MESKEKRRKEDEEEEVNKERKEEVWIAPEAPVPEEEWSVATPAYSPTTPGRGDEENEEEDEWGETESESDESKYWFTKDKIDKIDKVHRYLDSLPAVGKVFFFEIETL